MARGMAPIRRAVNELLRQSDRGGIDNEGFISALREMLRADAQVGRQATIEYHTPRRMTPRMAALTSDKEVRRRMLETIERGVEADGHLFYDTRPMRAMFEETTTDPEAFDRFIGINAALSPQSNVPDQMRRAIVAHGSVARGEGVPVAMPDKYGHFLWKTLQQRLANNVVEGKGLDPVTASKTASFRENLRGNLHPDVATIDKHATALPAIMSADPRWLKTGGEPVQYQNQDFVPRNAFKSGEIDIDDALEQPNWWGGRPPPSEYRDFVGFYRSLGEEVGLPNTAATQAAAWRGGDDITGVDSPNQSMTEVFTRRVMELAEKHSMSLREALMAVVTGRPELLSLAAASPLLARLLSEESADA